MKFNKYKFHPSSVGNLMVNPKSKKEVLSKTTKSYLLEIYIEEEYNRKKDITNKYMEKGILTEEDSITLLTKVSKEFLVKNKKEIENEFVIGTPDVILKDKVIDMKSSWDIWTFAKADGSNKLYYWQLQCYMWLTGTKKAELVYCLNDAPNHLIVDEKVKQQYKRGLMGEEGTPAFEEMETEVERNMTFGDIPDELKVKRFAFEYDEDAIEKLRVRIFDARDYLSSLSL